MKKMSEKAKVCYLLLVGFVLYTILIAVILPIQGQEMGYCILNYYILFPMVSFICGIILGTDSSGNRWGYLLYVGLLGILMPIPVFHSIWWGMAFLGMIPALLGIFIVSVVKKMRKY